MVDIPTAVQNNKSCVSGTTTVDVINKTIHKRHQNKINFPATTHT